MKIDRLISIIMILLERDKVSASKLAEMFEVTPRTIFRDIDSINQAGIPIVTYPGVRGGIAIMEQYKIEKRLFTISDITALLTGLGSIHSTLSGEEILNAMAKVKGLIPEEQVREIEQKSGQIVIDHAPWLGNKILHLKLSDIRAAMDDHRLLAFSYSDQAGRQSSREVEPYRLIMKDSNWYLQGYCTSRQDFRIFRLSRITALEVLEGTFLPREFDPGPLAPPGQEMITLKLLIEPPLRDLMLELAGEENVIACGDNRFTVHFPFAENDFGYNMLLRMGDQCECLEPPHVRAELVRRIKGLLAIYEGEDPGL
ncbi:YafY family protein [Paenibacillus sp. MMS20-IR301]|uniref:helix-turn-helix transcriptional regulator n=1 Tax=Paenibacillus sp. MMS20-IR301 TaxID=2895946 RepID=UPI0028E31C7A|nr:YafY family protein [Paenibacillus sp. MMS20-IR301]WNS44158.1 YafY family protein [Paenibacillus sp. MMS20-IR301]